jgi:hypothetical protein
MLTQTIKRLTAAMFAGGLLAVVPLAMPAANAVPVAAAKCPYNAPVTTTTTLSLSPSTVSRGETFTATAHVTSSVGAPPSGGTVTFTYHGTSKSVPLVGGEASTTFTATSSGAVRAVYSGLCTGGEATVGSSTSGPVILGVEASRGQGGGGGNIAGVSGNGGGLLAATGLTSQTELYGLLGVGMVAVGGLTLMVHRRRVQA